VSGGSALLVAEDDGKNVSRSAREALGVDHLHRLQSDVLPAICPWLHGYAATLSRVSARVPGPERALDRRRVCPRGRPSGADVLHALVVEIWRNRREQSLPRHWTRVADDLATAYAQLP